MITDIQKLFLEHEEEIRKKNPRKASQYRKRIRERIDHMNSNLKWLARNRPDILQDVDYELVNINIPRYRRARALLEAASLFENEPTILSLIAEIYSDHQLEIRKK